MKLAKKTLLACTAAALIGSSAYAASITVEDSFTGGNSIPGAISVSGSTYTIPEATLGFSPSSADMLAVLFTTRDNEGFSASYNGQVMTPEILRVASGNNDGAAGIFYLENPTIGGDLVLSTTEGNVWSGASLFALLLSSDGTIAVPFSDSSYVTSDDPHIKSATVGANGGVVLAGFGRNGDPRTSSAPGAIASDTNATSFLAYWDESGPGTVTATTTGNDHVGVIAYFEPIEAVTIPEPGSLLVGAVGLAGLAVRRRRNKALQPA